MSNSIASVLAAAALAGLAGCESNVGPNAASILAYRVDASRDRSVRLTREGVWLQNAASTQPLQVALPGWVYAAAPYCPPAVALGPKGEVLVTSNVVPTVWKIDPTTLEVTAHALELDSDTDKDVGFSALVYSADDATFIAYSEVQRSVWKLDPLLKGAAKVASAQLERSRRMQSAAARAAACAGLPSRFGAAHHDVFAPR
jgi:hypothetical protein